MGLSRAKLKGRSENGSFVAIPHAVLNSQAFLGLDGWAVKCLVDLLTGFKGQNNGDLSLSWSMAQARGWRSPGTLQRAKNALVDAGLIVVSRQGGKHKCSLYAVTWRAVDECGGKLDIRATLTPLGHWKDPV